MYYIIIIIRYMIQCTSYTEMLRRWAILDETMISVTIYFPLLYILSCLNFFLTDNIYRSKLL